MKEILKENLIPLYHNLLDKVDCKIDIFTFCIQWGEKYFDKENSGILFVGKATNGWVSKSRDINVLFGENGIFDRKDQMKWIQNLENNTKGYNTKNSAFWRLIKRVTELQNGKNEWYNKIAWSNLYKISFEKGNPNEKLKQQQLEICKRILETEIKILQPKIVIFLTSGWEHNFVNYLIKDTPKEKYKSVEWGNKYKTKGFLFNNTIYILSHHPQGKNENEHTKAIIEILNNCNK